MGVALKPCSPSRIAEQFFFGISGALMEHNAIAKSKETFFLRFCINGPGLYMLF